MALSEKPIDVIWAERFYGTPPPITPHYDAALARELRQMLDRDGCLRDFYRSPAWRKLRKKVLEEAHGESIAELYEAPAKYVPADTVHHVLRANVSPGYALSEWALDNHTGMIVRNLIPLSHYAHNVVHERVGFIRELQTSVALIPERW